MLPGKRKERPIDKEGLFPRGHSIKRPAGISEAWRYSSAPITRRQTAGSSLLDLMSNVQKRNAPDGKPQPADLSPEQSSLVGSRQVQLGFRLLTFDLTITATTLQLDSLIRPVTA